MPPVPPAKRTLASACVLLSAALSSDRLPPADTREHDSLPSALSASESFESTPPSRSQRAVHLIYRRPKISGQTI